MLEFTKLYTVVSTGAEAGWVFGGQGHIDMIIDFYLYLGKSVANYVFVKDTK